MLTCWRSIIRRGLKGTGPGGGPPGGKATEVPERVPEGADTPPLPNWVLLGTAPVLLLPGYWPVLMGTKLSAPSKKFPWCRGVVAGNRLECTNVGSSQGGVKECREMWARALPSRRLAELLMPPLTMFVSP